MRIAIAGATGPTGQLVVEQALRRGHEVVAYVRRPDALLHREHLIVVGGQLDDTDRFADAIRGCDVLICTLGTRSRKEPNFISTHLPLVTNAMEVAGIPRLVLMSALGGGEVPRASRGISRWVFDFLSRKIFGDRTKAERALASSSIAWSAVYPGFLSDKPAFAAVETASVDAIHRVRKNMIPRANVAAVLLDLAEDPNADGRRLVIARRGGIALA